MAVRSHDESGSSAHQRDRSGNHETLGDDRVVPPVAMTAATLAFFFDVLDFPARGDLAIASDDASASEGGETEQPNETVHKLRPFIEPGSKLRAAANRRDPVAV